MKTFQTCTTAAQAFRLTWHRSMGPLAAAGILLLSSACSSGDRVSNPASPSPAQPSLPAVTYTVSGTVTEASTDGVTPVEGVQVRQEDSGHQTTTDGNGFYRLTGLPATTRFLSASKPGYATTQNSVVLSGDTRLDLQMSRNVTYILSGVVFEMSETGRLPIQGVSVYCDSCGDPFGHTYANTDESGVYRFAWTANGATALIVGKEGYALAGNPPRGPVEGWIVATVSGDTRFDIELVRR
jgi:carboxypeptidase family protein